MRIFSRWSKIEMRQVTRLHLQENFFTVRISGFKMAATEILTNFTRWHILSKAALQQGSPYARPI
jgi:hypothetical protein